MKILYISNLSTANDSGLNWSVPASIKAQEKIDDCFWVNMTNVVMDHWKETKCFHNLQEFGNKLSLSILPADFGIPEIVVFEGLYFIGGTIFARELRRNGIPYIIIPRSSLTKKALTNHAKWKKRIAHWLFFNRFIKEAAAIQYLTLDEYKDSGDSWNSKSFILPNGFSSPQKVKSSFSPDSIKAIFIGRLDIYHKGIDILLETIKAMKNELALTNFSLCIYGPPRYQYHEIKTFIEVNHLDNIVSLGGGITGIDKERALLNADLFVLTSRFEGHPMGLIEALAYGVPVLVTPGTNMAKEISDSNSGWVCQELSVSKLSETIHTIISEKTNLQMKSINAMNLAKRYDWDKLAIDFHNNIKNIMKSK